MNRDTRDLVRLTAALALGIGVIVFDHNQKRIYNEPGFWDRQPVVHEETLPRIQVPPLEPEPVKLEPIRITSYWDGDGTGSGSVTASGLGIDDFQVNESGFYTWQGKVVLAAATVDCLNATSGACSRYTQVPEGFRVYELFDEVTIALDEETELSGVILDSCGASFWKEPLQRYDLFVANPGSAIDQTAYLETEGGMPVQE